MNNLRNLPTSPLTTPTSPWTEHAGCEKGRGGKVVRLFLYRLVSMVMLLQLIPSCRSLTQLEMDAEVNRLCAIDGGLKIYETVNLPPERFNKYNQINFYRPTQQEKALGSEYIWKCNYTYLQAGGDPNADPRIWKAHYQLIRRVDSRLLGESISYTRFGGDSGFFFERYGGHNTHYTCPEIDVGDTPLLNGVFIKTEIRRQK